VPKTPTGAKRSADVIGNAVHVMRIATGEIEDKPSKSPARAKSGKSGGKARAKALTAADRKSRATAGAKACWKK
jgi:hypothetical protein